MKILCLGEMMPIGSCAYRIRHTEAKKMAQRGHGVTLVTPHHKRRLFPATAAIEGRLQVFYSPGWTSVRLRRGGFSLLDMLYKLWTVLKLDFDVLHVTCGHRPAQLIPALAARFLKRRPIVDEWWEWYGSGGRAELSTGILGRLIGMYDCLLELPMKSVYSVVIAISSKLKDRLKENRHVYVLHGGVEVDHLRPGEKGAARQQLGISEDLFLIGLISVGRAEHNDVLPFLLAFRQLALSEPRLQLFVTGEESYIREEFLERQGGTQVIYQGWLDLEQYNLYLRACDVFVLPLSNVPRNLGRWPHKIGDFLYFERPIITNPVGDFIELFSGKRIGFLCENKPYAYCELITRLLRRRQTLSLACSDSWATAQELSSDKRLDSLLAIYREVCTKGA
ncbi:MAG: glycosyltransferase [Deltaproteobacteria bacterium]|nr:glycosyltransferase [Deltaproteobacteria bacterium]